MYIEIPQYVMRAYALFFSKHGSREEFRQSELDWIVGQSMKKKIFALLLKAGWIKKGSRTTYKCEAPNNIISGLMEFRVPEIIKKAEKPYTFTNLSAIEMWSDYSYVQRSIERSPYFIKILKKDLGYWKSFFNKYNIPTYVNKGSTIGEYIILIPVEKIEHVIKDGVYVDKLKTTIKMAKSNDVYLYAYEYMRRKYGNAAD